MGEAIRRTQQAAWCERGRRAVEEAYGAGTAGWTSRVAMAQRAHTGPLRRRMAGFAARVAPREQEAA